MRKKLRIPQPVHDLYRDLRDRRLLIPAIALVVAIVAVPVVMSRSAEPAQAPITSASAGEATAVEPAVLVDEQSGVRSYKDRLAALKEKNPFEQKFALPTRAQVGIEEPPASDVGDTGTPTPAPLPAPGPDGSDGSTPTPAPDGTPPAPDTGGDGEDGSSSPAPPKPDPRFYNFRVDVKIGAPGEAKRFKKISSLKVLPNEKDPIAVFLGLGEAGNSALFSISSDVVSTKGDGNCYPKRPKQCRYLRLKEGQERLLVVGPEGEQRQVRLKLVDIHIVRVPDPRKRSAEKGETKEPVPAE